MPKSFVSTALGVENLITEWESKLAALPNTTLFHRRNKQNRTIKQIVGHMIDSASNNTHRVVHLQYQESPFEFPNYASNGNNDRWIAIQHYQEEDWLNLIQLWKYSNLHYAYIIRHIDSARGNHEWIAGPDKNITLHDMVVDYLRHLQLHLDEITELINMAD
jgi:hypothetical protein